jgi:hypothetical protein
MACLDAHLYEIEYMSYVFLIKKQISTLTLEMYWGLHFQFPLAHYRS